MSSSMGNLKLFLYICGFRILNALLLQTQFDPDEYWQNLEPAYCRVFGDDAAARSQSSSCEGLTWEWKRRPESFDFSSPQEFVNMVMQGPVRSYASILPTLCFYKLIQYLQIDSSWMVSKGPTLVNSILVAAPTDWSVWYMARYLTSPLRKKVPTSNHLPFWCLFCSLSSWFNAYALVRTYSNSMETALVAVGMALLAPELFGENSRRGRQSKWTDSRARLAFFLGGISTGIRFTSLTIFVPIGLIIAYRRYRERSLVQSVEFLLDACLFFGSAGIGLTILLDSTMYGFWAVPFLGNYHFNVILDGGQLYGTHPVTWYLWAGIPAITGLMLPFLANSITECSKKLSAFVLWGMVVIYTAVHSTSAHKEFRFLMPLMPVFCLLAGSKMQQFFEKRKRSVAIFALANLTTFFYLGIFHQRAPIDVNKAIVDLVRQEPQTYTIHYLCGCHSTPLHSHLHKQSIHFETWHLDCSPDCRQNSKRPCESDIFTRDPGQFMEDTYFQCKDFEEGTCVTDLRIFFPDFLVAFSSDLPSMKSRIATMGMTEAGRFLHGITGLRIPSAGIELGDGFDENNDTILPMFSGMIELRLEEIVLFQSKEVHPHF